MIEAADAELRDDPLTDRPVDAAAAAERERSAKAAKLAAQTANAMVAVQGQGQLKLVVAGKGSRQGRARGTTPTRSRTIPNNSNTHITNKTLSLTFVEEIFGNQQEITVLTVSVIWARQLVSWLALSRIQYQTTLTLVFVECVHSREVNFYSSMFNSSVRARRLLLGKLRGASWSY